MDLEGIKARADAARAPCVAYWLIVFTYLMIHLFPVAQPAQELIFTQSGPIALLDVAEDWISPTGVDEIPILPALPARRPESRYKSASTSNFAEAPRLWRVAFEARGPPAVL